MKRFFLSLICISLFSALSLFAQKNDNQHAQWIKEMKQAKLEFMAKELKLTNEQTPKFNEVYNIMQGELDKIRSETRRLEKSVENKNDATDLEYEKAAEAMFEYKIKEGTIEKRYFDKFKAILTPQQLLKFKKAEMKWLKELMKHRKKK